MRSTVKLLLVLAVTAGMLVLTPQTSWACSCAITDTATKVRDAGTVIDGTLDWEATNGVTTTYSVVVSKVFKGRAAVREKIISSSSEASCGLGSLATGRRYLFFVEGKHPGKLTASLCGGTVRYDAALAAEIQQVTGTEPTGPSSTPATRAAAEDNGSSDTRITVGAGAALVVLAAGLLLARRRRRG